MYSFFLGGGDSPASECYMPTFRNTVSVLPAYTTYEEGTECSKTSAHKIHTSGNHPKERIRHSEQGGSETKNIVSAILNLYSTFRHVHSLLESEFSRECDLVLPLSISLRSSCSCLTLLPRLPVTSILSSTFHSITCFRRRFLCNMWLIELAFLLFAVCMIFFSFLTLCNTSSFLAWSVQLIFSILLQHQIPNTFQVFAIPI